MPDSALDHVEHKMSAGSMHRAKENAERAVHRGAWNKWQSTEEHTECTEHSGLLCNARSILQRRGAPWSAQDVRGAKERHGANRVPESTRSRIEHVRVAGSVVQ